MSRLFGALWTEDDAMPSCDKCMAGNHVECRDLIWNPKYGTFACGCENVAHNIEGTTN